MSQSNLQNTINIFQLGSNMQESCLPISPKTLSKADYFSFWEHNTALLSLFQECHFQMLCHNSHGNMTARQKNFFAPGQVQPAWGFGGIFLHIILVLLQLHSHFSHLPFPHPTSWNLIFTLVPNQTI